MDKLRDASLKIHVLPELTDVDTMDNLKTLLSQAQGPTSEPSRTRSFLEQHRKSILK
jgi:hypothetical protein